MVGHQLLEGLHDGGGLRLLVVGEAASERHHQGQDDPEVEVVCRRIRRGGGLDTIGNEAEDGTNPEHAGEPSEEVLEELHPLGSSWWRSQLVQSVLGQAVPGLLSSQTRVQICPKPGEQLRHLHTVNIQLQLLLQVISPLLLT